MALDGWITENHWLNKKKKKKLGKKEKKEKAGGQQVKEAVTKLVHFLDWSQPPVKIKQAPTFISNTILYGNIRVTVGETMTHCHWPEISVPTLYEPFSSDVKPEAASTFSRILLSFMTLVAHT